MKKRKRQGKQAIVTGSFGSRFSKLSDTRRSWIAVAGSLVVVALAIVVPVAVYRSMASTGSASVEPELGSITAPAASVTDSTASGGRNVQFGNGAACGGPITISTGGTYSGCYASTDINTPAVKITTTAAVTINRATIHHAGVAITAPSGANLTLTNSTVQATSVASANQRVWEINSPVSVVVEHNNIFDGQGFWNGSGTPGTMRFRYNEVKNIGRYPHPATANCCVQFVQMDSVTSPGIEIAWNRITNTYGQSDVEDNVNMYKTSGTDSAHPIDIHHNLVDGAYPRSGDATNPNFTGGGLLLGDSGFGAHGIIHDNRVINTADYGVAISGGQDNHLYNNRIVSDINAAGTTSPVMATWAQGIIVWDTHSLGNMTNDTAYNNVSALIRPDGRADWWLPNCTPLTACTGNVNGPTPTAALEQAERDGWAADLAAAGLTVGPN